jgi:mRNA-degrading endonuclease RelE of RelBE toxin-antitoxin system
MAFQIEFKPRAVKDLEKLSADLAGKVIDRGRYLAERVEGRH